MTPLCMPDQVFAEFLQTVLIGRLVRGTVHNINGPVQILSMQIELAKKENERNLRDLAGEAPDWAEIQKRVQSQDDRLRQMEEVLERIKEISLSVITRKSGGIQERTPVLLPSLIQEEVDFWHSDLFFKHQVQKDLHLQDAAPPALIQEHHLRDLVDALLGLSIECLRPETDERRLEIRLTRPEDGTACLAFSQTGGAFPWTGADIRNLDAMETLSSQGMSADGFFSMGLLATARIRCEELDARLVFEPQRAVLTLPV